MQYTQLFNKIDELLTQKERAIVAIEGNSGAGKSSLAESLRSTYSCNAISMDSFFLRLEQRTPERLSEPGGNVDYERFSSEVLKSLKTGDDIVYRPYDCKIMQLTDPVHFKQTRLTVVEGVYSMHPYFTRICEASAMTGDTGAIYDIRVFLKVNEDEQRRRLRERNPMLLERFINEWIPMENAYFKHFKIPQNCDYIFDSTF